MSYIKKTNVIETRETSGIIKRVQCPYCYTYLEPIPEYVTAMLCWKCKKEFRIERDKGKWEGSYVEPMNTVTRTALI